LQFNHTNGVIKMNYESGNEVLLKELIGMSIKVDFADKGEINEPYATEYREELQYIKGIILARMEGLKQPLNFTKGTNVKPRTGKVRIVGEEDHIHIPTNHDLTVNRVWYEGKGLWSVWVRGLPTKDGYGFNTESRRLYLDDFEVV